MPSHFTPLHEAAANAVAKLAGVAPDQLKVDVAPRAKGKDGKSTVVADLAVGCFTIGKAKQQNPAQVAQQIAAGFVADDLLASATAAGPYVNFRVNRTAAFRWILSTAQAQRLVPQIGGGKTICIDYSSPNISKHLAYHHIRSTMIGHSLVQSHRALGYQVIGINHLGDWGTPHGHLMAAYKKWGATEPLDVTQLNSLYLRASEAKKADKAFEAEGRGWFKKLEDGDPEARTLWTRFRDISLAEYQTVYDRLGIAFEEVRGESAYEPELPRILDELTKRGFVETSDGALVVRLDGEEIPYLLKTKDGTTLYSLRDIAAAEHRWNTYHPQRSLYVVDRGQSDHFRQLFKLLAKMGHEWARVCEHIPFGLVRIGGKKTGSRSGNVVMLKEVIAEAERRVRDIIVHTNAELPVEVLDEVAPIVGTGAVVFANLAAQRDKDIDFEWEQVVNLRGDSGVYLQYNHARCASIIRKAGGFTNDGVDFSKLTHDAEWAVASKLIEFPDMVVRSAEGCEPHIIAHYLLDLAGVFSSWYTLGNGDASLRVLVDDVPTRHARLALVAAVQATLREGLSLLGIAAPDQM